MEPARETIIEQGQRLYRIVQHSSEGHYQDARRWEFLHLVPGIPATIFSAVAGASALAQFENHNILAAVLAITVAVLTALATFLNPGDLAASHQTSGDKFNALKNNARFFHLIQGSLTDDKGNFILSDQELAKQLQDFLKQKDELNQSSLPISGWAYRIAKRQIERRTHSSDQK